MSDTPRTDACLEYYDTTVDDVKDFARQLEREINAANSEVYRLCKANLQLREGAEEQKQRIKRLENIISRASTSFFEDGSDRVVAVAMLMILDKAKEAKL